MLDWGEEGYRTEAEIAGLRSAFTQEVIVWHKLNHPNVTKVHFLSLASTLLFLLSIVLVDYNIAYQKCEIIQNLHYRVIVLFSGNGYSLVDYDNLLSVLSNTLNTFIYLMRDSC